MRVFDPTIRRISTGYVHWWWSGVILMKFGLGRGFEGGRRISAAGHPGRQRHRPLIYEGRPLICDHPPHSKRIAYEGV